MKKRFCTLLGLAMVASLLAIAAPSAQAAPPFAAQNFNPQDSLLGADGIDRLVLSDKFDGVDSLAHLTGVATTDTTSATWVVCPDPSGFPMPDVVPPLDNPIPPPTCQVIGTDTQGEPVPGFGGDLGFEFFWDIPSTFDQITRSVGVYYCKGTATGNEPGGNCLLEVEPNVFIDNGQSGSQTTTAAELLDWCVDANADGDCDDVGDTARQSFDHPEALPNLTTQYPGGDVIVRATSSDDGISTLTLCVDLNADAQNAPNTCAFSDSSGGSAAAAFKTYEFSITYPDNAEMAFFLHNINADGSGYCDGFDCLFDTHYVVSSEPEATTAGITFLNPAPGDPTPPGGPVPAAGKCTPADTDETNQLGDSEFVRFCVTDQFGNPFSGPVTFESTGPEGSGFTACSGGTLHDHDADGRSEHCHTTTGTDGTARATINNTSDTFQDATPGDQVVTACSDQQSPGAAPPAAPPVGHGCADETVKASVTKHWVTAPRNIELVFAPEGTFDAQEVCLTGDKFKENVVGDTDTLIACTFDAAGNFVSTMPADNGRLQWFIFPSGGGELTATRFNPPPPNETGADGSAIATIEAFRAGNDLIEVCLRNDPGGNAGSDCDLVQKRVTQGTTPPPPAQCQDGVDNDGDGLIDFPDDPGCESPTDPTEGPGTDPGPTGGPCQGFGFNTRTNNAVGGQIIVGSPGNDILIGTDGDDIICGLGGDDIITAGAGSDQVVGNAGNDTIDGGAGKDTLRGGADDDTIEGGDKNDVIIGGGGDDTLRGNSGWDTIRGGRGKDTLQGGKGNDILRGGRGHDTLKGFTGDDLLNGGAGTDTCIPGPGNDIVKNCER
ncbi:MAG: calcium-binding protein [Actinomycetota bacterium]